MIVPGGDAEEGVPVDAEGMTDHVVAMEDMEDMVVHEVDGMEDRDPVIAEDGLTATNDRAGTAEEEDEVVRVVRAVMAVLPVAGDAVRRPVTMTADIDFVG